MTSSDTLWADSRTGPEGGGEFALAFIAYPAGDLRHTGIRLTEEAGGLLHAVLFQVGSDGGAVHILNTSFNVVGLMGYRWQRPSMVIRYYPCATAGSRGSPDQPDLLRLGAPLGTGHVHDLLDELVQQPGLGGVGGVVIDLLAVAAGGQQAAVPEDAEVVGDGRADISIMAAMFTTHSSQWHNSQKMRMRLASPSCRKISESS